MKSVQVWLLLRIRRLPLGAFWHMPVPGGFILIALFIWIAENIGTCANTWLYADQRAHWHLVSVHVAAI